MSPPRQAALAGVLVLAMALAVLLPPALGALGPFLIADLGLGRGQIGVLASVASFVSAVLAPGLGRVVDDTPGPRLLAGMFGVIGSGLFAVALAPTFPWLVAASMVVGVGMATSNPGTNRLVAGYAAPGRRGTLIGIKQSGVQVGALFAGAVLPVLANLFGWRGALATAGVVAFAAAVAAPRALHRSAPAPPGTSPPASSPGASAPPLDTRPLAKVEHPATDPEDEQPPPRETAWLAGFSFVMAAGTSATVTYLPLYGFDAVGYSPVVAGWLGASLALVGIAGRIGWARFADRRGDPWRVLVGLAAGTAGAQVLLLLAPRVPMLLWVGAAALGATAGAWNAVVQLAIVRAGLRGSGRRTGVVHLSFSGGMVVGPALFGLSVERLDTYAVGWSAILFLGVTAAALAVTRRGRGARAASPDRP